MQTQHKLKLVFTDRVGIVADVAAILAQQGLNIVSMEVQKQGHLAFVYVEAHADGGEQNHVEIFATLECIPNCLEFKEIHTLPQEKREEGYKVVLDSVSDGILSIDENAVVTTINRVACKIQDCAPEHVIGQPICSLRLPDPCLPSAWQRLVALASR